MKVKIGPQYFEVMLLDRLQGNNGEPLDGHIRMGHSEIQIDTDLDDFVKLQTLWHEIIHGILCMAGLRATDEAVIESLAYGIVNVLAENPALRTVTWTSINQTR